MLPDSVEIAAMTASGGSNSTTDIHVPNGPVYCRACTYDGELAIGCELHDVDDHSTCRLDRSVGTLLQELPHLRHQQQPEFGGYQTLVVVVV